MACSSSSHSLRHVWDEIMTKKEFAQLLKRCKCSARLYIHVEHNLLYWEKTRYHVSIRASKAIFPARYLSTGWSSRYTLCGARTKEAAVKKAEKFLKWLKESSDASWEGLSAERNGDRPQQTSAQRMRPRARPVTYSRRPARACGAPRSPAARNRWLSVALHTREPSNCGAPGTPVNSFC